MKLLRLDVPAALTPSSESEERRESLRRFGGRGPPHDARVVDCERCRTACLLFITLLM